MPRPAADVQPGQGEGDTSSVAAKGTAATTSVWTMCSRVDGSQSPCAVDSGDKTGRHTVLGSASASFLPGDREAGNPVCGAGSALGRGASRGSVLVRSCAATLGRDNVDDAGGHATPKASLPGVGAGFLRDSEHAVEQPSGAGLVPQPGSTMHLAADQTFQEIGRAHV